MIWAEIETETAKFLQNKTGAQLFFAIQQLKKLKELQKKLEKTKSKVAYVRKAPVYLNSAWEIDRESNFFC